MVLYGVLVALIILLLISFKGPIELVMLHSIGINLIEGFKAGAKSSGVEGWVSGGALTLILVVQPIAFGILALRLLEKIFQYTLIAKLDKKGFLRLLEKRGSSKPKSGADLKEMISQRESYAPPIAEDYAGVAAGSIDDLLSRGGRQASVEDALLPLVTFRGSPAQVAVSAVLFCASLTSVFLAAPLVSALIVFLCLAALVGPTMILYLATLAGYTKSLEFSTAELKILASPVYEKYLEADRDVKSFVVYYPKGYRDLYAEARSKLAENPHLIEEFHSARRRRSWFKKAHRVPVPGGPEEYWVQKLRDEVYYPKGYEDLHAEARSKLAENLHLIEEFHSARRRQSWFKKAHRVPGSPEEYWVQKLRDEDWKKYRKSLRRRRWLIIKSKAIFARAWVSARWVLLMNRQAKERFAEQKSDLIEQNERVALPSLARILEILGERRGASFQFRSHVFVYELIEKHWSIRKASEIFNTF